jgi:hypothetical protein
MKGEGLTGRVIRILQPGFFLENFDGFIGSIAVAILKNCLGPNTDVAFIVSEQWR